MPSAIFFFDSQQSSVLPIDTREVRHRHRGRRRVRGHRVTGGERSRLAVVEELGDAMPEFCLVNGTRDAGPVQGVGG